MLNLTAIILEVLTPIFLVPSAFVVAHSIAALHEKSDKLLVGGLCIGLLSYIIILGMFIIGILLKSRSVVLTNLTFQVYDPPTVLVFFVTTTVCVILTALFKFFDSWFYVVMLFVHLFVAFMNCYRNLYMPFYTLFRNPTSFTFGVVTTALDIYLMIQYFKPSIPYYPTVYIFLVTLVVSSVVCKRIFLKLIDKTKQNLQKQDGITNYDDYFDEIGVCKNSLTVMKYIVVGLAEYCPLFYDGHLTDYIISHTKDEKSLSLCLQILTYFPCESHKMNILYKKLMTKKKLSFINRFLIYQISEIKTRRLVSNSKDTLELSNKLHMMNNSCKYGYQQFWDKSNCPTSFLVNLSNTVLINNPNNVKIANEYANFLAECLCDFNSSIYYAMKADAIVDGNNFNVDVSFRSLAQKFPRYLKDEIYDTKGSRVKKTDQTNDFTVSNHDSSKETFDGEVDAENEEFFGKKMIKDSKLRLAFHNSIQDLEPPHARYVMIFSCLFFIIEIGVFVGTFIVCEKLQKWRKQNHNDVENVGTIVFYSNYAQYFILRKYLDYTKRYNESNEALGNISADKYTTKPLLSTDSSYVFQFYESLRKVSKTLRTILDSLSTYTGKFRNYELAPELLFAQMNITECVDSKVDNVVPASLTDKIVFYSYEENYLAGNYNQNLISENIFDENDYCQLTANTFDILDYSIHVLEHFKNYSSFRSKDYYKYYNRFLGGGLVLITFFSIVPLVYLVFSYRNLVTNAFNMLLSLSPKEKEDAKQPLTIGNFENSSNDSPAVAKEVISYKRDIMTFLYFVVVFVVLILFAFILLTSRKVTKNLRNMDEWLYLANIQMEIVSELGNNAINFVLMQDLNHTTPDTNVLLQRIKLLIDGLQYVNDKLINGDDDYKASIGFDSDLDSLETESVCELGYDPKSVHDMYCCSNLIQQISMFKNIVDDIVNKPEEYNGTFDNEYSANLVHMLEFHLYPNVVNVQQKIYNLMNNEYENGISKMTLYLIFGLILSVVNFLMAFTYKTSMIENFKFVLILFQHLPPHIVASRHEILSFFRKTAPNNSEEMPISKSIVYGASEGIIITNQNAVVEIINPSITENIGLTPDQMLGQEIINFVSIQSQQKILSQLDLMMNGQGSLVWQDHIEMINDNGKTVPFSVTMIGMKDNENDTEINSIVFILTNETEEIKKRNDAEQAKAKSEKLLYQILPKDIVVRLNRGEKDISFSIPIATIFFIDIVKFSNYSATLSPSEIMQNLSLVFATFDKNVSKYQSITKIKLIGDVYMAAAGLFNNADEKTAKDHATEAVNCCLQCIKSMTDINTNLESSLEVRVGVNSGGPLIGGVLGTDKPTFDIIGDPINVAARLQSTDIPGNVQISEETKNLIESSDFIIEERGEVYLKGKGNRKTYFVRHPNKQEENESFALNMISGNI
ncbi:Adenylate and Guanylate cyclase catalytic domain containing protein [Trichomonas vaginalis G3]|uniref:Adenylate and Guanylate cyclase catalytic domain containing protein n=1 Tax=Trichomonas vaginalis (strain ATCC PRA-98 / G3) TaxID=412133 RepID=A2FSM3_TRIV3|nr:guanylate cyclase protein [Trichomonas vaginalis G3]EAX92100.1 Adenylate and Guanylate cyclase catalytic domain containing protein [Trichomonas vaginalis G3]KAI5508929.1 guanylate cyclase protein [Trichomonas vaginalis G3]|eukprot:XP_001305030.1 Adenylate and Guanylate cyclase catalytic domain containing protein [Trichomonas vaginalis G3]